MKIKDDASYFRFLADSEIGQQSVTEVLTFNVSDTSSNVLPSQTLTLHIDPDNNQAPKVNIVGKMEVGGHLPCFSLDIVQNATNSSTLYILIFTFLITALKLLRSSPDFVLY